MTETKNDRLMRIKKIEETTEMKNKTNIDKMRHKWRIFCQFTATTINTLIIFSTKSFAFKQSSNNDETELIEWPTIEGMESYNGDPSTLDWGMADVINDVVFAIISIIGVAVAAWGIYQLGISIAGHDTGSRIAGIATFSVGILLLMTKPILTAIGFINI